VKSENWFAVAIDFFIVVVGVFIGLQVANWNEARTERQLSHEYVKRLTIDLENDLAASKTLTEYYDQVLQSVETTDRLLSLPNPDAQAVIIAAYRASEFTNNPQSRATWDQIVSSGHLSLLPDAVIDSGLSDYYKFQNSNDDVNALLLESPYRLVVRSLIPLPLQLSIREGCSDVMDDMNVIHGFASECLLNVDPSTLKVTADALRASKPLRESLRYQYSMVASVQVNNGGNLAQLEVLLKALSTKAAP